MQDLETAAAEYSRRWLPNAHAVADLTEEGFGKNTRAYTFNLKLVQASRLPACLLPGAGTGAEASPVRGPLFRICRRAARFDEMAV